MSEAEYVDDIEMQYAIVGYFEDDWDELDTLRSNRLKKLVGKYVITCKARNGKDLLYYQDRSISKNSFWTKFLSNAFGFSSKIAAETYCKRLRYNEPKIWIVDRNCRLQRV